MKKILLFSIVFINLILQADQKADLEAQLASSQTQLKALQDEVLLYNQSLPILNNGKQLIESNNLIIKNITTKLEDLTGVASSTGTTSYNKNAQSNAALTDVNTKLQHEIDDLTSQNNLIDSSIVTARSTLGDLRTKNQTNDIKKNITFYQDKIAEYLSNKSKNDQTIQKNRTTINNNKNTITLNDEQIKTYQAQIDAAKKIVADNQAAIDAANAKLAATPNKINFSNVTMINNQISKLQDTINSLNSQILNL